MVKFSHCFSPIHLSQVINSKGFLVFKTLLRYLAIFRLRLLLQSITILFLLITPPIMADSHPTSSLDEIIQAANRAGVQVIVINPTANTQLETMVVSPQAEQRTGLAKLRSEMDQFKNEAQEFVLLLPDAKREMVAILRASSPDGSLFFFVKMLGFSLIFFAIGYWVTVQTYGKRLVGPWFIARQVENPVGYTEKLPILVTRFLLGIGGTLCVMLIAYILDSLIFGKAKSAAELLSIGYIYFGFAMINFVSLFWRMILSPYLVDYRIPKFHPHNTELCTRAAKRLYLWLWIGATIGISFSLLISWLGELGVSPTIYGVLNLYFTGISALYSIAMVIVNKAILNGAILQGKPAHSVSLPARIVVKFWSSFAVLYFLVAWFDLAYDLIKNNETRLPVIASFFIIVISVIVVYAIVSYIIEQFFQRKRQLNTLEAQALVDELVASDPDNSPPLGEEITSSDAYQEQLRHSSLLTFEDLATRVASMLAFVAGLYALLSVWNASDIFQTNAFIERSSDVIFILFVGYITYNFFKIWIDSKIAAEGGEVALTPGDEGGAGGASRLGTLLPLFRNFLLVIIFVSVSLIALAEMGINVAPLFAGAGVVGLAIGFGSQTLVRDVFSGAFFLFDDAFRKGEYVDLGDVKGTVEKVSVRSFQLRHHLGRLHTVPFGEIRFITNYSRDWVMMKLPLRVTYDTDVEKVRKLVKKLGQRMLEDPEIGHQFLQPLKSQGVIEMQDSAMIIRVKFMTKPGDQWVIRKKVYSEIRRLFVEEGIKFAHKEVTVRIADNQAEGLSREQKIEIAGAAALIAIDEKEQTKKS